MQKKAFVSGRLRSTSMQASPYGFLIQFDTIPFSSHETLPIYCWLILREGMFWSSGPKRVRRRDGCEWAPGLATESVTRKEVWWLWEIVFWSSGTLSNPPKWCNIGRANSARLKGWEDGDGDDLTPVSWLERSQWLSRTVNRNRLAPFERRFTFHAAELANKNRTSLGISYVARWKRHRRKYGILA